jgi:hypothetical protein
VNLFKVVPFVLLSMASSANAGTWCVMDEVYSVDTSANTGSHCWVAGYLNVNGTATAISDLSICSNTDAAANARNLSLALTAFTANKKLRFYFNDYTSCTEVKTRWEGTASRIKISN